MYINKYDSPIARIMREDGLNVSWVRDVCFNQVGNLVSNIRSHFVMATNVQLVVCINTDEYFNINIVHIDRNLMRAL